MLMDIFSSFDEQNGNFLGVGFFVWFGSFLGIFFYVSCYWWGLGRVSGLSDLVSSFSMSQISRGRGRLVGGFSGIVASLMVFLLVMNISGLVPYLFSNTSHLVVTFSLSCMFWLSLLVSSAFFNFGSFMAVLLPVGAPSALSPFLVLVEAVSLMVRPITLAVRLAANMGAGHIVLCLLGNYLSSGFFCYSFLSVFIMSLVGVFYFIFELAICLIQSYIFFLLVNLYGDEHC
uniref:ATP synthase subunit a n=1 Tax=Parborlasia corrugatus TaxID=187802 RepID=A0A3Q8U9J6_PARCG|nr:ATP synthase F0 subunit 6 [Parborlasia corrugatus]